MRSERVIPSLLAALWAASFAGCATPYNGPRFTWIERIPPGMGLVYFYRPAGIRGIMVTYDVWVDGSNEPFTHMDSGGYFPVFARPGKTLFKARTEAEEEVEVDVRAGETYYVKCSLSLGIFVGRPDMTLVTRAEAEPDLRKLGLLPGLGPSAKAPPAQPSPTPSAPEFPASPYNTVLQLFNAGRFAEAASESQRAYRASEDPAHAYNAALSYRRAGMAKSALEMYVEYLRKVPDSPCRPTVEGHIVGLKQQLQSAAPPADGERLR